jgi:DNA-binding NarL/FixJ family response regulator
MKSAHAIRVLIVDDHPVVRYGLSAVFDAQPDVTVVACAESGGAGVEIFQRLRPDVVIMDLRMPGLSGVGAIRAILAIQPKAHIIVLTTYQTDEDIHQALDAGARGYLLKAAPSAQLLEAVRRVHAGFRFIPLDIERTAASRIPSADLTPREREVLGLIVKGLSNKRIGEALGISEGTVKWHVNIILERLGVEDRTQAAVAALQRGLAEL